MTGEIGVLAEEETKEKEVLKGEIAGRVAGRATAGEEAAAVVEAEGTTGDKLVFSIAFKQL